MGGERRLSAPCRGLCIEGGGESPRSKRNAMVRVAVLSERVGFGWIAIAAGRVERRFHFRLPVFAALLKTI
jgi:hypothetical protein